MRLYIAGPMTGLPQFNIPAFDEMAALLRARGHEVVSPAELDNPETRRAALASPDGSPGSGSANGETWGDFLARDVKLIADDGLDGIVVLPGWNHSRGARLETFVGHALCAIPVMRIESDGGLRDVPDLELFRAWCADGTIAIHATFRGAIA